MLGCIRKKVTSKEDKLLWEAKTLLNYLEKPW